MIFNSIDFLFFILLVWLVFSQLKNQTQRQYWLLASSLFFYGYWKWEYLLLMVAASSIDYWAAKQISASTHVATRKKYLMFSIGSNILTLCYFKYGLFFANNLVNQGLLTSAPSWLQVLLPVGISFYTFQAMAYVLDVYRNRVKAEQFYPQFLLFISFFPQLVAGPIERAPHLLHQLRHIRNIFNSDITKALAIILLGFWKKLFLADRLGVFVDSVFDQPSIATGWQVATGTMFFGLQIYCDFSGYSDIARGIGRFFGVDLMVNFNSPYQSKTLTEFWRRWHISLSGWFRDYVYFPLGGNRNGSLVAVRNLLIVFTLSGLWHGANWTFLVWGFWHGAGVVAERFLKPKENTPYQILAMVWVFAGWMIFRANSVSDLGLLIRQLGVWPSFSLPDFNLFHSNSELLLSLLGISWLFVVEANGAKFKSWFLAKGVQAQMAFITTIALMLIWFGAFKGQDFIYFQF